MFAKPRMAVALRVFLMAVILFNALSPTLASAKPSLPNNSADSSENQNWGKSHEIDRSSLKSNNYLQRFARPISDVSESPEPVLQSSVGWLVCDKVGVRTTNAVAGYCDPAYSE